jgi:Aspartyl protease
MRTLAPAILLIGLSLSFPLAATACPLDSGDEIPFTLEKGHLIVTARIKGNTPVEVVLATGAEQSLINGGLLEKYKLQASYDADGIVTGSHLDKVKFFVRMSEVTLGDIKATDLLMGFGGEAAGQISQRVGREIFAILGADFFKGRVVQFDFGKKVLRLLKQAPARPPSGTAAAQQFAALRMTPSDQPVHLPITEDATFNGKKLKTVFDTGALTVISLTPTASKQLGLTPPPDKGPPRPDKISAIRFAEIEFADLPVTLHAKGSDFDRDSKGYGAVVGVAVIQNFVITFDFHDGVIVLERL